MNSWRTILLLAAAVIISGGCPQQSDVGLPVTATQGPTVNYWFALDDPVS